MTNYNIQMVDLKRQYQAIKDDIDQAIQQVIDETSFINGPAVKLFASNLAQYLNVKHVIPCANGTDALQIAFMALGLKPGDEVIVPCFTYVATAETIALLKLKPILTEVDPDTFNITAEIIEKAITPKTKAVVPVHLFGQCVNMEPILAVAKKHNIFVIEDCAQATGAEYTFEDGSIMKAGTMGHVGCTSFFPSKNLGCYGDGGAIFTNDTNLGTQIQKIANHGQAKKYYHEVIGVNSRLDSIQAAILNVKLPKLDSYSSNRNYVADFYNKHLGNLSWLDIPVKQSNSSHVYHQYTIKLKNATDRDPLKDHLAKLGIPSMIYYPVALHLQDAFKSPELGKGDFPISEDLCSRVLSLPIHTEMDESQLSFIISSIQSFK